MKSKKCLSEYKIDADASLLLGNGLLKSHPTEGTKFDFQYENLAKELKKLDDLHVLKCPEDVLDFMRIELSLGILKTYIEKFKDFSPNIKELRSYVQKFQNIFTTNYDPITYRTIFTNSDFIRTEFRDGFNTNQERISLSGIKNGADLDNQINIP